MNKLALLLIFIFITLVSCDGRDRVHKTNQEVLFESKLLDSFSEKVEYIPETYTEQTIDSIYSNGIIARMKFYTDMENTIYIEELIDSIIHKTFFREFVVDVKIDSTNKSIFNEKIDKSYLVKKGAFTKEETKLYIINDFNISSYKDIKNDYPMLTLHYVHIESKKIKIIRFYFIEKPFFEIIT